MPFDCLPVVARSADVSAGLSNSFGFGGQNVSLIFVRPEVGEVQPKASRLWRGEGQPKASRAD